MGITQAEVKALITHEINELESRLTMKMLSHTAALAAKVDDVPTGGKVPNEITSGELYFYINPQKVELRLARLYGEAIVVDVTPLLQAQIVDYD